MTGKYGGLNGTGGLDGVSPYLNQFNPVISDYRGNILGEVTNGVVSWFAARPTGYGAVPGRRPIALGHGADVAQSSAWRGHETDITGYYQIGLRTYDPIAGNWLSYDPVWNEKDPNYLTFCGGDPVNGFDSNGKCVENAPPNLTITATAPQSSQNQNASGWNYDTTATTLGIGGIAQFGAEYGSAGATIGNNGTIYWSGWGGGSRANISTVKIGELAHGAGPYLFGASVAADAAGAINGNITWDKFGVNTGFGTLGLLGGLPGAAVAGTYSTIDNFYPGGWPGYVNDQGNILQSNMQAAPLTWPLAYPIIGP
jgi:RHS repeat-associated protein